MVTVDSDVRLEVLDWGGSGRPVVLLAGLGNTAHVFDNFAPQLAKHFHVYGITRRGFGQSSAPSIGYGARRLGDDVVEILDELKLQAPVLVGHSIAGQELSSILTEHPGRAAGFVYLDAGYSYALYNPEHGDYPLDLAELTNMLLGLKQDPFNPTRMQAVEDLLPKFQRNLALIRDEVAANANPSPQPADLASFPAFQAYLTPLLGGPEPEGELHQLYAETPTGGVGLPLINGAAQDRIFQGSQKFTELDAPTLAIFVLPNAPTPARTTDPQKLAAFQASEKDRKEAQVEAFRKHAPQAHVVVLPNQSHYVFLSDEPEVLKLITNFVTQLPASPRS